MSFRGANHALPFILLSVCFPAVHAFDVLSEIDTITDLLLDLNEQECSRSFTCSNQSIYFIPINQDGLCCSECECYDYCMFSDFCCPDAFNFTDFAGISTDVRDLVTKAYTTKRNEELQYRYSFRFNTTEDLIALDEFNGTDIIERSTCISSSLLSNGWEFMYAEGRYLVSTCSESYPKDSETYFRCEGSSNDTDLVDIIPETSMLTYISYKNKHCRMCNEANISTVPWEVGIYCIKNKPIQIPPLSSLQDLINFDAKDPNCIISFQPSRKYKSIIFSPVCLSILVSSCNVSGKWETYDSAIELACETIYSPVESSIKNFHNGATILLQNIACFVCNSNKEDTFGVSCSRFSTGIEFIIERAVHASLSVNEKADWDNSVLPSYGILRTVDTDNRNRCEIGQFYDENQNTCRSTFCPRDYEAYAEICLPIYETLYGINIEIKIKVKFEDNFFMTFLSGFEETIVDAFIRYFSTHDILFCSLALWQKFTDDTQKEIDYFFFHAKIKTDHGIEYSSVRSSIEILVKQNEPFGEIPDFDNNPVRYIVTFADGVLVNERKYRTVVSDSIDDITLLESSVNSKYDEESCFATIAISQTSFCERIALYPDEFISKNDNLIILPGDAHIPNGNFDLYGDRVLICIDEFRNYMKGTQHISLNIGVQCMYLRNPGIMLLVYIFLNHL